MRVLLIAPSYDAQIPGESWSTYKWVQGISAQSDAVVLTQHRRGWDQARSPTEAKLVVNWNEPEFPGMNTRFAWELKPGYLFFYRRARRWLQHALASGEKFDLIHQINPLALRYPCPACGLGVPYIIGPLAGSLPTPRAFKESIALTQWYRVLRNLDSTRLRHDPWLRNSYSKAATVIGVAPYVRELLTSCSPPRFEIMAETGIEQTSDKPKPGLKAGHPLRLLFVGRLISTKGILEAIESVALARKSCAVTFDIVGAGDLAARCEQLIAKLGLGEIIRLHGRRPKNEVFDWYEKSDAFLFPSYREPSGNVVFEAMSRGLPVIASTIGGPGNVVTDQCGFRIPPDTREQFVADLAAAIEMLAKQSGLLPELSAGALQRVTETALWPAKITRMMDLYRDLRPIAEIPSVRLCPS
jgi:glycosyltransferase involved in cell wall biosynthesis